MKYLIRFAQTHETFRQPELQALANLHNIDLEILHYDQIVSVCLLDFSDVTKALFLAECGAILKCPSLNTGKDKIMN